MTLGRRLFAEPAPWDKLAADFRWPTPPGFNIAEACCDSWAAVEPERVALIHPRDPQEPRAYTFGELKRLSDKLAGLFEGIGLSNGGRVALLLPQTPETVLAHLATYKRGGVVVPLSVLFGEDALRYRLADSEAEIVVTDRANLPKITAIRRDLPMLREVLVIDGAAPQSRDLWAALLAVRTMPGPRETSLETPAMLIYTSGTTGPPKGALHGHRVLIGHLPALELVYDFFPRTGDVMWTPADWAWMGGLCNSLLPALYYGVPTLIAAPGKFDPDAAWALITEHGVSLSFLPPTALKYLRRAEVPAEHPLRAIGSGGEALGAGLLEWGREALGLTINEFYGSTECNLVLANSDRVMAPKPGSTGRAVPGKRVTILRADGSEAAPGETGEIAVHRENPTMFLEYWGQSEATAAKFSGDWFRMGDEGTMDEEGYVTFSARTDDVITSSGYRVGPSEIEECLMGHPDVLLAAAIGVPDADKGEVVKAFVTLREGAELDEAALIDRVRTRISPHVAPKSLDAIATMPLTTSGKIMRRALRES